MNGFNTIAILLVAYLAVFAQATFNGFRDWFGVQMDLLPSLVVYTSLTGGIVSLLMVAVCGGLWVDSLSVNPIGVTMLPLFLVGLLIHRSRELILRDQTYAQFILGASASAAVPFCVLVSLINLNRQPLVGWFSLWQWFVMSVLGGLMTPVWFVFFDRVGGMFNYRPLGESSFRADREIKRGR